MGDRSRTENLAEKPWQMIMLSKALLKSKDDNLLKIRIAF